MYISNLTHFLDDSGNIPKEMPKEAREMAGFLALVVDVTTQKNTLSDKETRCFIKGCDGKIISEFSSDKKEILWKCSKCDNAGRISFWQNTKWDNTSSI